MEASIRGLHKNQVLVFVVLLMISVFAFSGCFQSISSSGISKREDFVPDLGGGAAFNATNSAGKTYLSRDLVRFTPVVKTFAERYELDWILVMALMQQESQFSHDAISEKGAYGLMQLMPMTQIELTEKLGIDEAISPRNNIRAGVYHLRTLNSCFQDCTKEDRIRLVLAAYNAGIGRIQDAQRIAAYLGNDPNKWENVKTALPYLSRKFYTIHRKVWPEGRPPSGYFGNYRQTDRYVDAIMRHYEEFEVAMR